MTLSKTRAWSKASTTQTLKKTTSSYCTSASTLDADVRKAAGAQSLSRLQQAIESSGYSAQDLDTLPAFTSEGKSALQMAAWKGSLENLKYLIETVGCNVNGYSQATFSYGKTPIFFAATQSRVDIVEYLLWKCPTIPQVAIVNNKGQSVWTLAASHDMPEVVLERIQELERQQKWWNFRASHSDGLEYGDLDKRFLDRPLRSTDVVVGVAVNPTTKKSRRGGFARRNPQAAQEKLQQHQEQQQQQNKMTRRRSTTKSDGLTGQEQVLWEQSLEQLGTMDLASEARQFALLMLVRLGRKQRRAWIPQIVDCLMATTMVNDHEQDDHANSLLQLTRQRALDQKEDNLVLTLLDKVKRKLNGLDEDDSPATVPAIIEPKQQPPSTKPKISKVQALDLLRSPVGQMACQAVAHLSIRDDLESSDSSTLCLPQHPEWVDTIAQILCIHDMLRQSHVIGIDAEWCTEVSKENGESSSVTLRACTFQIALIHRQGDTTSSMMCFVVDLLKCDDDDDEYAVLARQLIAEVVQGSSSDVGLLVLGFSIGHDLPILESYVGRKLQPTRTLLDLQHILSKDIPGGSFPGLKACTAMYSNVPLSKKHQCSNWGQRPLSQEQLEYAGLDAAILLYLLSEYHSTVTSP